MTASEDALPATSLRPTDTASGVPIYRQIVDQLAALLEPLATGTRLPSESEIARVVGVSRGTAVQALRELEHQELVVRVQGRGTFKASPKPGSFTRNLQAGRLPSFTEDLREAGHETREVVRRCDRVPATDEVAATLGVGPGDEVWALERTILADERPVVDVRSWLRTDLYADLDAEAIAGSSLYSFLSTRYGADGRPSWADEEYTASTTDADLAAALGVPSGSGVLVVRRTAYLADGQAAEFVESFVRADAYRVKITVLPATEGGPQHPVPALADARP
ncbi:GntR family transcriptional regulator [Patulibacter sp. S7RM1-6]